MEEDCLRPVWCGQLDRCSDDDLMMMILLFPDSRHSSFGANTHGHKLKCLGVKLDPRPKVMLVDAGLQKALLSSENQLMDEVSSSI